MVAHSHFVHQGDFYIQPTSRGGQYYLVGFSDSPPGFTPTVDCFGSPALFTYWFSS